MLSPREGPAVRCTHLIHGPMAPRLAQVWNINACTGVVGVFNVQGSAYCRQRRGFHTHDPHPPALTAAVSPADIPALKGAAHLYAVYSDSSRVSSKHETEAEGHLLDGVGTQTQRTSIAACAGTLSTPLCLSLMKKLWLPFLPAVHTGVHTAAAGCMPGADSGWGRRL